MCYYTKQKSQDYLCGSSFEVYTDNNPLTYLFKAKLNATGHRWLAALSNYNCTLKYRSGKKNDNADGLSRMYERDTITTVLPDVFKTVCHTAIAENDQRPLTESLVESDDDRSHDEKCEDTIDNETLPGTTLTSQDWRRAQAADSDRSETYSTSCRTARDRRQIPE